LNAVPSTADIRGADRGYLAFHAPRFRFLLQLIDQHLDELHLRILDIGLSPFTTLLREHLCAPVDSLGLESQSALQDGTHVQIDLNQLGDRSFQAPPLGPYDVIVFAEVLEHLWTSPLPVLRFLRDALAQGGVLIVQTPNAASLFKRLKLLLGSNPYEMIRESRMNPGHFREYTVAELEDLAERTGLEIVSVFRRYYFDARFADMQESGRGGTPTPVLGTIKNVVYSALPPFLREGVTMVLRRRAASLANEG
jgi:SAM-dependent methyltransferase